MDSRHYSVLLDEAVSALCPQRGGIYVDCTAGLGGHSEEILKRLPENSKLISIDQDDFAIEATRERLACFGEKSLVVKSNFQNIGSVLDSLGIEKIDGALWDLGVSSVQLDEAGRGFSYMQEASLDMRMDRSADKTAFEVVNGYGESELNRIIRDFGEEKFSGRISRAICDYRTDKNIETTTELAEIISNAIPSGARHKENQHPAKRTFQAIRIEVNAELAVIEPSLECAINRMNSGGRASVITFHSLEDRIVKSVFKRLENPCTCPPSFPQCVCGKKPVVTLITRKPILPGEKELEENPRSRSAKLRVAEKI